MDNIIHTKIFDGLASIPIVHGLQTGAIEIQYKDDEMSRIIGAYLANDKTILEAINKVKQIKQET